jgi:hypothetical protein
MKEINFFFESSLFLFPWQLRQSLSYKFRIFLAYLVPLDEDVTGNITAKPTKLESVEKKRRRFLSSNFMKHSRNIHRSVWKLWLPWQRPPF